MTEKQPKKQRRSGVTLVEVLVAMVILVTGIFVAYQIFPMGFAASYRAKNKSIATHLATQKIEEIMSGRQVMNCLSQSGRVCKFRPVHVDEDPSPNPFDENYDCRYNYSSAVQGRGSTYEQFDTGPPDDPGCWLRFPAPNDKFWYHVEVVPVLDPGCNYENFDPSTDRLSIYRDFGSLVRLTVRVGGPIDDLSAISYVSKGNRENVVEVILSSFVTDKNLASAEVITDEATTTAVDCNGWNASDLMCNRRLLVSNIRNFPMFNQLTAEEKLDLSLVYRVGDLPGGGGGASADPVPPRRTVGTRYVSPLESMLVLGMADRNLQLHLSGSSPSTVRMPVPAGARRESCFKQADRTELSFAGPGAGSGTTAASSEYSNQVALGVPGIPGSTLLQNGNLKRMDNVIVELWDDQNTPLDSSDDIYLYQTNKVVTLRPDNPLGNPAAGPVSGYLCLCQPLYVDDAEICNSMLEKRTVGGVDTYFLRTDSPNIKYRIYMNILIPRVDGAQILN